MNSNEYQPPKIWIYTWVDYSKKYGIGYQLCNKSTGVYFKDGSKMTAGEQCELVAYMDKNDQVVKKYTT